MKKLVKALMTWFIEKINLNHLLAQLHQKQNLKDIQRNITDLGATFYPESIVVNAQDRSKIVIGNGTHIRGMLNVFNYGGKIMIGEHCYVGDHSRIWSGESITIGNFVQISHNVNIMDTNAHELDAVERAARYSDPQNNTSKGNVLTGPIVIGDYAWICLNATILRGVKIGKGAIVGANAVVTNNVADYTMVAGNPAVFIKKLDE